MAAEEQPKIIFSMNRVSKIYPPNKQVLKDIWLSFFYGAKIGIIGLNGSGKSTLLKIIAGIDKNYQGDVAFSPGYSVGYLAQEPELDNSKTVKEVVQEGVQEVVDLMKEYEEVNNKFAEPMSDEEMNKLIERQGELTELLDQHDAWELDAKLERAMDALNCPEPDASVATLSGGERRRVALCRLLLQEPDILLLDEPTNHLDAESIQWLEAHLQQYKGTVIAVTHDRGHVSTRRRHGKLLRRISRPNDARIGFICGRTNSALERVRAFGARRSHEVGGSRDLRQATVGALLLRRFGSRRLVEPQPAFGLGGK